MAFTKKDIDSEIVDLASLKSMVGAYEEVAISRMRKIRDSVLKTRNFIMDITKIFQEVRFSYRDEFLSLLKKKKAKDAKTPFLIKKNGKHASVLLSSNTGLYGDIVKKTFDLFQKNVSQKNSDIIIIGKLGRALFEQQNPGVPVKYFDLPDSEVSKEEIRYVIDYILNYEKILLFYGQFENVISQVPVVMDIYGNSGLSLTSTQTPDKKKTKYLFEPKLEDIAVFFEKQIFASVFEQATHESNLAKYASRMVSLDNASGNIDKRLERIMILRRIAEHRLFNKKQLDSILGVSLWRSSI